MEWSKEMERLEKTGFDVDKQLVRETQSVVLLDNAARAWQRGEYDECERLLVREWAKIWDVGELEMRYIPDELRLRLFRGEMLLEKVAREGLWERRRPSRAVESSATLPTFVEENYTPPMFVGENSTAGKPWPASRERPTVDLTCPACGKDCATVTGHLYAYPECSNRVEMLGYVKTEVR